MTDRNLIDMAADVMKRAYAPYSGFKVGAAVEASDGSVFTGCNVESAAYRATICAEATAVSSAVAAGHREFKRIAVISEGSAYCFPCGVCRQMLYEFAPELEVLCARADGRYVSYPLTALLPMAFGREHMGGE